MSRAARAMRAVGLLLGGVAGSCLLAACSGSDGMRCEDQGDYAASTSAPPIRVPGDLSVPNESEALRVPLPAAEADDEASQTGCLERPPDYFEGGRP